MGVNRGLLLRTIRRLQASGRLRSRVGSGVTVVGPPEVRGGADELRFSSAINRLTMPEASTGGEEPVFADFSRLAPDEKFLPHAALLKILADTWKGSRDLWQYAPPFGHPDLRREIAGRMSATGAPWSAEEILVTSGAQQGLDLLFKTFVDSGDAVAVESPTYPGVLPLLQFYGARCVEIPVRPGGRDLSAVGRERLRLIYTMPERQNPTGQTLDEAGRRQLLAAALSSGAVVIEDGYETPVSGIPPLSAMNKEHVVTVGSFSKDLAPGFRVGWVAADRSILWALALAKQTSDLQTPLPLQVAIAEFLRQGGLEGVRRRRNAEVERRRRTLREALERNLPDLAFPRGEDSSPLVWLELPPGAAGREVARRSLARGVRVAPGADFDPLGRDLAAVRLSVSRIENAVVGEGIARLAKAVGETQTGSGMGLTIPRV
jgi:2-aminoadipate transaminase